MVRITSQHTVFDVHLLKRYKFNLPNAIDLHIRFVEETLVGGGGLLPHNLM